jgi:hypothetical protein
LFWWWGCTDGVAELLSSHARLVESFLLAWTAKSQRADHSDVGVLTRGYSLTRRLRSTDQGKGGSDVEAGEGDAEAEADRQRSCN